MHVIGFDPGLGTTGFGVIDASGKNPVYVASGIIKNISSTKFPLHKRLAHLYGQADNIISKYQPNYCAVEEVFSGPFAKSGLTLATARGAILSALGQYKDIELHSFSPTEVKKMITGKGSGNKADVSVMMQRHLKLTGTISNDASDALALALCSYYSLKR